MQVGCDSSLQELKPGSHYSHQQEHSGRLSMNHGGVRRSLCGYILYTGGAAAVVIAGMRLMEKITLSARQSHCTGDAEREKRARYEKIKC